MPTDTPSISIVLATYNGEAFIHEQLDSIAAQTMPFDELLIRDDGSYDNTPKLIEKWIKQHPHVPARVLPSSGNLGFIRNFSALLSEAKGDLIFLCDQDDRWHPDKVKIMSEVMMENPQAKLVASSFEFMNQHGSIFHISQYKGWTNQNLLYLPDYIPGALNEVSLQTILLHNGFQGCSMAVRKDIAERYVSDKNYILPHDWQLALLAALNNGLYYLDKRLFDYRIHSSNTTSLPQAKTRNVFEKVIRVLDYYYRTAPFSDRRDVLRSLQITAPELWNEDLEKKMFYYIDYLDAIDKKSFPLYHALMKRPEKTCMSYKDRICGYMYIFLGRSQKNSRKRAGKSSSS